MLEYIILGTLYDMKLTGYDIRKCIERGIGLFYKASFGSIYPLLNKLLNAGLLDCTETMQGKRIKKMYSVTAAGKEAFITWLEEKECNEIDEFMAVIFFIDRLPQEKINDKITDYEKQVTAYLSKLEEMKHGYDDYPGIENYYYKLSTLDYGIYTLINLKKWCKKLKRREKLL